MATAGAGLDWYNVAVFALVALLSPLLPASKAPREAPEETAAEPRVLENA
ncbi:hypothetical protein [Streptomyces sp. NBC_01296]|nr:hypothetical protein OG299_41215 [Streptomyces sp. NBC_01296]